MSALGRWVVVASPVGRAGPLGPPEFVGVRTVFVPSPAFAHLRRTWLHWIADERRALPSNSEAPK